MKSDDNSHSWAGELAAISEFLARWQLEVSFSGFLRVQPTGPTLEPAELAEFIGRMRVAYEDHYPAVVVFDFSAVAMSDPDLSEMRRLLQGFATDISGRIVVTSPPNRRLSAVIIRRHERGVAGIVSSESETAESTADRGEYRRVMGE